MRSRALYFTAPGQIEIREQHLSALSPGRVLVQTVCSAISPGTEMLVYRGQFPRELALDEAVYRSESETGFRNRAIAWMLKNFGVIDGEPMAALENYFRQCSVRVTCRDLACMAATLAKAGRPTSRPAQRSGQRREALRGTSEVPRSSP